MPLTHTRHTPRGPVRETLRSTPDPIEARALNRASMARWVLGQREIARSKPHTQAMDFLYEWHDWLGRKMSDLPSNAEGWAGLDVEDLAEAQRNLIAREGM